MSAIVIPFPNRTPSPSPAPAPAAAIWEEGEDDWFVQAMRVLDEIERRIADGAAAEMRTLCTQALWFLVEAEPEIGDAEAVMALVDRLRLLHHRAARTAEREKVRLARRNHPSAV